MRTLESKQRQVMVTRKIIFVAYINYQFSVQIADRRTADELERQLKKEIKHLTFQCEELAALLENGKCAIHII